MGKQVDKVQQATGCDRLSSPLVQGICYEKGWGSRHETAQLTIRWPVPCVAGLKSQIRILPDSSTGISGIIGKQNGKPNQSCPCLNCADKQCLFCSSWGLSWWSSLAMTIRCVRCHHESCVIRCPWKVLNVSKCCRVKLLRQPPPWNAEHDLLKHGRAALQSAKG